MKTKRKQRLVPLPVDSRYAARAGGYVRNEIVEATRVEWTAEEYHSEHAGGTVSRSELQMFAENPRQYRDEILQRKRRVISDDMRFGQCLHMEALGGHEPAPRVPADVLTKDGKRMGAAWKNWLADYGPYYILEKEVPKLEGMIERIRKNEAVAEFLQEGGRFDTRHESTILAKHEPTGLMTRCRYDIESVYLFDLKKTRDASAQSFASSCCDFGYHCQGAFYCDHEQALSGQSGAKPFILIAVQDSDDYRVEVYEMDEDFITTGRMLNSIRMDLFAMYQRTWGILKHVARMKQTTANEEQFWTAPTDGQIIKIKAPPKAMYQIDWEPNDKPRFEQVAEILETRIDAALKANDLTRDDLKELF